MSKSTKALATLGVVAALGISMLPLGAYATKSTDLIHDNTSRQLENGIEYTTSAVKDEEDIAYGNVLVTTHVDGFIALTIDGNNDTVDGSLVTANVVKLGTKTDGTADDTANNNGHVAFGLLATGSANINVKTNGAGYSLGIKSTDEANENMILTESGTQKNSPADNEKIPALGSGEELSATSGESAWGYKAAKGANTDANHTIMKEDYTGVSATNTEFAKSTKGTGDDGHDVKLTFGVTVGAAQAAGDYTSNVVITATPVVGS